MNENINIGGDLKGISPFSPPEAYNPPNVESVKYEDMHPILQSFMDEHKQYLQKLHEFEETLSMIENGKIDKEIDNRLREFFSYFDEEMREHHLKEEKTLFPIISKKMNANGEHSKGSDKFNVIDVLEDEHIKSIQLASVVFNMFALFVRIPHEQSRMIILDVALNQAKDLVELLRVHIFREDTIIFSYAQKHLSDSEFAKIEKKIKGE